MDLYIDATNFDKALFGLGGKGKIALKSYVVHPHQGREILARLDDFLKSEKILAPESQISKIYVNKGPGSYTGVRVGASLGQALSLGWKVSVKMVSKSGFDKLLPQAKKRKRKN